MAGPWTATPSGYSTGVNSVNRTLVDPSESIGDPSDAPATDVNEHNSAFSLLKGIAAALGVPAGDGEANTGMGDRGVVSIERTVGERDDPPATGAAGEWSAISLMKGILAQAGM